MLSRKPHREPKPDRSAEFASFTLPRVKAVMAKNLARASAPIPKAARYDSEAWRRAVASLPCMLCGLDGQTQAAHRNIGKGLGLKTDDCLTAALCVDCHREIDSGKSYTREERRERLDGAILKTIAALAREGLIGVV